MGAGEGLGSSYLSPVSLPFVCRHRQEEKKKKKEKGVGEVEGRMVTKPIIFTYLLLPASRHVILNGLSDPWAGFEPLENMVSQMKLSQETACVRQRAFFFFPRRFSPVAC